MNKTKKSVYLDGRTSAVATGLFPAADGRGPPEPTHECWSGPLPLLDLKELCETRADAGLCGLLICSSSGRRYVAGALTVPPFSCGQMVGTDSAWLLTVLQLCSTASNTFKASPQSGLSTSCETAAYTCHSKDSIIVTWPPSQKNSWWQSWVRTC